MSDNGPMFEFARAAQKQERRRTDVNSMIKKINFNNKIPLMNDGINNNVYRRLFVNGKKK